MFLFLYPFWGQKLGHDGNGERSNIRRMSGGDEKHTRKVRRSSRLSPTTPASGYFLSDRLENNQLGTDFRE